jgi:iron complex transport system substrate-binding protein
MLFSCRQGHDKKLNADSGVRNERSGAEKFTLEKKGGYTLLTILNPWQGAGNVRFEYFLVKYGSRIPAEIKDTSHVIYVPVKKVICMSTTHVAMISALGEEKSIAGISGTSLVYSPVMNETIKKGSVKEVGYEASLNNELILRIAPDVITMYGIGSESSGYVARISELGIKFIFIADYLENDPLGKAEWIKVFGALYLKESLADSIYKAEYEEYQKLKNEISRRVSKKPFVLLGLPFKDTWFVSPGNSYISRLISDAGGTYLWSNVDSPVSMPMGIENVYLKALRADYWLNPGTAKSRDEIISVDKRLGELPCFKDDNVYNNNLRITDKGGNDYWESGTIHPHLILKDTAAILHPGLFGNSDTLYYYRRIK